MSVFRMIINMSSLSDYYEFINFILPTLQTSKMWSCAIAIAFIQNCLPDVLWKYIEKQ